MKSRDFVNLRCWHLCRSGKIIDPEDYDDDDGEASSRHTGSVSTLPGVRRRADTDDECLLRDATDKFSKMNKSMSDARLESESRQKRAAPEAAALSKSLGAKAFLEDDLQSCEDESFADAQDDTSWMMGEAKPSGNVYVSAAISVPYISTPPTPKYTRYYAADFFFYFGKFTYL